MIKIWVLFIVLADGTAIQDQRFDSQMRCGMGGIQALSEMGLNPSQGEGDYYCKAMPTGETMDGKAFMQRFYRQE